MKRVEPVQNVPALNLPALARLALVMSLGSAVGQGFGRFAYALLLAPMRSDLSWSYAQAGLMGSANALGYLLGALVVGLVVARWGPRQTLRTGLLTVCLTLIGMGLTRDFAALLVCRAVNGLSAGLIYVGGAAIVMEQDPLNRSSRPLNFYFAGPGIGIAVSGLVVPLAMDWLGWSWSVVWVGLGVLGLGALALIELPLRRTSQATVAPSSSGGERLFVPRDYLLLWPGILAYALFGLGYIGYMTFVVAFLQSLHVQTLVVQGFWVLVGLAAALTGLTWGPLIQRLAPHRALVLVLTVLTGSAVLPVLAPHLWSFGMSGLLFGGSFLGVVSALTRQVRMTLPPSRWTTVTGNATALFAVGQLLGPTLTGFIADQQGGLAVGLLGSAACLAAATGVMLLGPKPAPSAERLAVAGEAPG